MKNTLFGRSIIDASEITHADIEAVTARAKEMRKMVNEKGGDKRLTGKIMAALFYEPSSRTFSSFVTSMQRLGGGIIPLLGMNNTSVSKGETLEDTARVFSAYADVLVMRHPEAGSVKTVAENALSPVINAGDGIGEHPTQGLIDLFTIREKFKEQENLHILFIGDLAHYRPVNSLSKLLSLYPRIKISFVTPEQVPIQGSLRKYLQERKIEFSEQKDFLEKIGEIDVLYVTRVKKEYMDEGLYHKIQGSYIVDKKVISRMKKDSIVMHCLPRVGEIHTGIDQDPRSIYFTSQLQNGLYVRMALLDLILRKD